MHGARHKAIHLGSVGQTQSKTLVAGRAACTVEGVKQWLREQCANQGSLVCTAPGCLQGRAEQGAEVKAHQGRAVRAQQGRLRRLEKCKGGWGGIGAGWRGQDSAGQGGWGQAGQARAGQEQGGAGQDGAWVGQGRAEHTRAL